MKATGIVRRMDELGRIVIPKEMRKSLRIKEGDNLEIYITEEENIVLKKYSQIKKLSDFAQNLTDSVQASIKKNIIITDSDIITAASGSLKKELLNKSISEELETKIKRREEILEKYTKKLRLIEDEKPIDATYAISPIIINGDCNGLVLIVADSVTDIDFIITGVVAEFIKKNLEV